MSVGVGACTFETDSNGGRYLDEGVLNDEGVWSCPHDAEPGGDRCIFHLSPEEKDAEEVTEAFFRTISEASETDETERRKRCAQFIGAEFGTVDLSGSDLTICECSLDFSRAKFGDSSDFSDVTFGESPRFRGAEFGDEIKLVNATFGKRADFGRATFGERADFTHASFGERATFFETTFGDGTLFVAEFDDRASFSEATFGDGTAFSLGLVGGTLATEFGDRVNFVRSEFGDETAFSETTFGERADFRGATFGDEARFDRASFGDHADISAEFGERADFRNVQFGYRAKFTAEFDDHADFGRTVFDDRAMFRGAEFGEETTFSRSGFGEAADFADATFGEGADFSHAAFGDETVFTAAFRGGGDCAHSEFGAGSSFRGADFSGTDFSDADLTGVRFDDATLLNVNFETSLLNRATLFGADLRGARLSGALLGDTRIDGETLFLGHPDDEMASPYTFESIRSTSYCVYDPGYRPSSLRGDETAPDREARDGTDIDRAKGVYRALEELGRRSARSRLQTRSFVRRQSLNQEEYWRKTVNASSSEERLVAGACWSRAKAAQLLLLYGESPWRIIVWGMLLVLCFGVLYPLGGWLRPAGGSPIRYEQILSDPTLLGDSIYYSTLTFTTLGLGDFQPIGFGQVLTTVETSLGAILIALLVFVFGRRASR